ncbi:MAG: iron complex outermembrane receptor protein [Candidatus Azotimanducaceae bacterium]|jgi:iron complex outermembrane receptor protein
MKITSNMGYKMNKNVKLTALSLSILTALSSPVIQAKEANDETHEIITVTATKRNADVQDVSVSVTVLNEDALKNGGIIDISRLENLVPGLKFGQSGSEVRLALRGTRTNNVGTEAEQVVGIFEDGVYVATTTQAMGSYVDVKRIEVLRGPQGTLYGRNTFGGTINIITHQPAFDEVEGYVSALVGSYDRTRYEGAVNIPLSDTFAARVAFMGDSHDGYIENTHVAGTADDLRDKDMDYFRVAFRWAPTSELDITFRLGNSSSKGNGDAIWGYQQIGAYDNGQYVAGHSFAPADASDNFDEGPWKVARNLASGIDLDTTFYTLNVDWDLNFATLTYTANLTEFEGRQFYDDDYSDGGSSSDSGFTGWDSVQETTSHELQLISNNDGDFQWLAGVYIFDQTSDWTWLDRVNNVLEEPHWDNQGDYTSDSLGVFGNITYSIAEDTRLVAGLRYAKDSKQKKELLDWNYFPPVSMPNSGPNAEWSKILWKVGVEHDLDADTMIYAQASTGYRAGGINFIQEGIPLDYDSETVTAYEAGYKSVMMGGDVVFNAAAYLNQYRDMQAQSFVILGTGATEFTQNGGELDAMGLELELTWKATDQLNISAQLALMDAEFGKFEVAKVAGLGDINNRAGTDPDSLLINLEGWNPALASDVTLGLQISYDIELAGGGLLRPYFQTSYSSDSYASDFNLGGVKQDAYTKSDFRLIWRSADRAYEIQAFVINLENKAVLNRVAVFNPGSAPDIASLQANWGNPRTWGVSASFKF